jgi:ATP/maltotriose-dependent transcriptional regulator MalT
MERLYEARLAASEELPAARAAFWVGMRLFALGERARAGGWLARAERLCEGKDCVERGYLLLPVIRRHEASGEDAAAAEAAARAEAIGDQFGETDLSAFARSIRGSVLVRQGQTQAGLALLDEAMVAATSGALSPVVTGLTYCTAIAGCQLVYELDRGREWTAALSSWCEAQPQLVPFAGRCLVHRAEILQLGGAWPEAIGEARQLAAQRLAVDDPSAVADAHYQEAEIHRLRGEIAEAEASYRQTSAAGREPHPGLALLWLAQGRGDAAIAALRRLLAASEAPLTRARFLPAEVEARLATDATPEAEAACRELEGIASRFGTDVLVAIAAQSRAAVELACARPQSALGPAREAFRIWQQLSAPYPAARARVLLGRACRALGDAETARIEEELAREVFVRLGAVPDLAVLDEPKPSPATRTPGGLTVRELEVLRLVATGQTNKAIAKKLFVSEKTIDRHVSNIFAKLNVASRAAATAYAYQNSLV